MTKSFKKHFRYYKKSGHPALIVDEEGKLFAFHRVTSSEKSGHHKNWEVNPNPQPSKKTPMFIVKKEEKDRKTSFKEKLRWDGEKAWKNKK